MSITLAYRDKWKAAIDRCEAQLEYGSAEHCELCKARPLNSTCQESCPFWLCFGSGCGDVVGKAVGGVSIRGCWQPDNVRPVLREMRAWLMAQEVVG